MTETQKDIQRCQERRGQALQDLIQRCKASGKWDGVVRNGHVTTEDRHAMAIFSNDPDVQTQLWLQKQAGAFTAGLLT